LAISSKIEKGLKIKKRPTSVKCGKILLKMLKILWQFYQRSTDKKGNKFVKMYTIKLYGYFEIGVEWDDQHLKISWFQGRLWKPLNVNHWLILSAA